MNRQKRYWLWTSGKTFSSFSMSNTVTNCRRSTRSPKNRDVVMSVAIPVGRTSPDMPFGASSIRARSANTAYALTSPRPVSGKMPELRSISVVPAASRSATWKSS
ncbi:hypothetical protein ACIQMR_32635 [Streptomyces sp. NPDC091376]|uniref:hypothetical protein n=1 Tax=Streptomyces sp. NPDC091376 TaxID=3365994 RepID=UPI003822C8E9